MLVVRNGLLLLVLVVCACGKRGAPLPPLPRGPLPPVNVAARQLGERTYVGLEVPAARGSKPAQLPVHADLVRVTFSPGLQPSADPDAFRRRGEIVGQLDGDPLVSGSRVLIEDLRLSELTDNGTGWTLRYAVRVRDRRGRPSALVVAEDLVPVSVVGAVTGLIAEPTADGVRLEWQPPAEAADLAYNVYRSVPGAPWPEDPLNPQPLAVREYLDSEVVAGTRYVYDVRVSLEFGTPYRESRSSRPRELLAEDRFAPAAPDGLVAVQEGSAVRLFWNPNAERDLAGYRVERRVDDGDWQRLGPSRIEQSSFLDEDVRLGQRLHYRVLAMDRVEPPNESGASSAVELDLVAEPTAPSAERP